MDGWIDYTGKKVFIRLNNGRVYSGIVIKMLDLENTSIFITINDKYNQKVTIHSSEIIELKEEQ